MSLLRRLMVRNMPLLRQLDWLIACGIQPNPGIGLGDLLARHRETEYERSPFKLLLETLGSETELESQQWLSEDIWLLNVECISGPGGYARVARRMAALAGGALPLSEIHDEVDARGGVAWLAFSLRGKFVRWNAKVQEDWLDPQVMSNFAALLEDQDTEKRFTYLDLPGRECLIGCATPEQLAALRKTTGLDFEWLG